MHKHSTAIISIFSLFTFCSCGSLILPELKIDSFSHDDKCIYIEFSQEPEKSSIQKAVTLKEDESTVTGWFDFSEKTVLFYPEEGIRKNYDYILTVSTGAETADGNSLSENKLYLFSTRDEKTAPEILEIYPENEEYVDTDNIQISIRFSEPISRKSFYDSFSCSPNFEYNVVFLNDDTEVSIQPVSELKINTEYKIKIQNSVEDLCRNFLKNEFTSSFHYKKDASVPDIKVTFFDDEDFSVIADNNSTTEHVPLNSSVKIEFTKEMNVSSLLSFISFNPAVSYKVQKDEKEGKFLIYKFSSLNWDQTYTLRIKKGMNDIAGNINDKNYEFIFKTNSEKSMNVSFIEGYLETSRWTSSVHNDDTLIINDSTNYGLFSLNPEQFTSSSSQNANLFLVFDTSSLSDGIDIYSAMAGISISEANFCLSTFIKNMEIVNPNNYENEFIDTFISALDGHNLCVLKLVLEVTNSSKPGFITLKLNKEISDTLGNGMKDNKIFIYNK